MSKDKYAMLIRMLERDTTIEVHGIDGPDEFLEFMDMLTAALPMFLVSFIRERVKLEYQDSMIRDSLMKFVLIFLDKAGISIPGLNSFLDEQPIPDDVTVH